MDYRPLCRALKVKKNGQSHRITGLNGVHHHRVNTKVLTSGVADVSSGARVPLLTWRG